MIERPCTFKNYIRIIKEKDCPICFENYKPKERIAESVCCKKYFHPDCIKEAFKHASRCPHCQNEYNIKPDELDACFIDKPTIVQKARQGIMNICFRAKKQPESEDEEPEPTNVGEYFRKFPGTEEEHFAAQKEIYGDEHGDPLERIDETISEPIYQEYNEPSYYSDEEVNDISYDDHQSYDRQHNTSSLRYQTYDSEPYNNQYDERYYNDDNIDDILRLSKNTYKMEQKYQNEMREAINKSNKEKVKTFQKSYDDGLNNVLYQIAIEESRLSELNPIWSENSDYYNTLNQNENRHKKRTHNSSTRENNNMRENKSVRQYNSNSNDKISQQGYDYLSQSNKEFVMNQNNGMHDEIQKMIRNRKSFRKELPKYEPNDMYKGAFQRQPISSH